MAPGRNKRKTSPVHRFGLTHGQEAVPKIIRENTEQFFAAATRRKSKTIISASKPIISTESQKNQNHNQKNNELKKEVNQFMKSIPKPSSPIIILPPIQTASSSKRPKTVSSSSICNRQQTLPLFISSPSDSLELSTPLIKSPSPLPKLRSLPKRQLRHGGPVDHDIFRNAYERALSVARSRLLFRDPYSLTRANATHGILYSYYDHTPMCIFSRGTTCNHQQDKQERKTKSNLLRKKIFDDVVVENYIR